MRALATIVTALLTAVLVASCGGTSGLIPSNYAATLQNDLTNIESDVQLQDCTSTRQDLNTASSDLDNVPASVNRALVTNLNHGLLILHRVAVKECRAPSADTGTGGPTSPVGASGPAGTSGPTGTSASTSTTSSTATTTSSAATTTSSAATTTSSAATTTSSAATTTSSAATTTGTTGPTAGEFPGTGGGTPAGDTTNATGIGGAGGAVSGN